MKKTTLLFLSVFVLAFVGCSQDELIQEAENGSLTTKSGDPCEREYPVMTGWYEHLTPSSGTSVGNLKINITGIHFSEHNSCRVFVYRMVNGKPDNTVGEGYIFEGHNPEFIISDVNAATDPDYKIRIETWAHYPNSQAVHYVYGDIHLVPFSSTQSSGSVNFIEVNKLKVGDSNW